MPGFPSHLMASRLQGDSTIPKPEGHHLKKAGYHWLDMLDFDGVSCGIVILQWNPGAQNWTQSGMMATGNYINTAGWRYIKHQPMPGELEMEEIKIEIPGQDEPVTLKEIEDDVEAAWRKGYQQRYAFCPETVAGLVNYIKQLVGRE